MAFYKDARYFTISCNGMCNKEARVKVFKVLFINAYGKVGRNVILTTGDKATEKNAVLLLCSINF